MSWKVFSYEISCEVGKYAFFTLPKTKQIQAFLKIISFSLNEISFKSELFLC